MLSNVVPSRIPQQRAATEEIRVVSMQGRRCSSVVGREACCEAIGAACGVVVVRRLECAWPARRM
jgi:hypothetical protein